MQASGRHAFVDAATGVATLVIEASEVASSITLFVATNSVGAADFTYSCTAAEAPATSTTTLSSSLNPSVDGQAVTFTAVVSGFGGSGAVGGTVEFKDGSDSLGSATLSGGVATLTTAVLAVGDHTITAVYSGNSDFPTSTSPQLIQTVTAASNDSQHLSEVQGQGSTLVATTTGAATSDAVAGAVEDGFGSSGQTFAMNDNGFRLAFGPEKGTDNAASGAIARNDPRWNVWFDAQQSGWNVDPGASIAGNQTNAIAGIGFRPNATFVVGALAGYERFDYGFASLGGRLTGSGWSAGGYAGWRPDDGPRLDVSVVRSSIAYDAVAGAATGSFSGVRWLGSAGLSGALAAGAFTFEPSARVYGLWESQAAYTDSLAVAHAANEFGTGRASGGGRVTWQNPIGGSATLSAYLGAFGDYRFSQGGAAASNGAVSFIDGWSARATTGVSVRWSSGATLGIDGELGGVGGGYVAWSARARAGLPF
ncbi:MAG: Ig-like domain repeat protein [Bauldia sp.]